MTPHSCLSRVSMQHPYYGFGSPFIGISAQLRSDLSQFRDHCLRLLWVVKVVFYRRTQFFRHGIVLDQLRNQFPSQ